MQMIEDAKQGEFDLIVTREVCRFARNTVDTLVMTRELKNYGVEVYFVEDNIWTMDGDGELRLTIMATLAQEESRKISERVRAGQKISRDNGVLYGSGNIIGYDRVNGTYVINEDQAETVRMIFDLYLEGLGETKICKELCRRQRKDGHGNVSWSVSKISRILRNATYMGYKCYLKSYSNNYLEQKRIKNLDESTYLYVKGDFEPIIPEEVFKRCEEIRKTRTTKMIVNKGERTYGKRASQDVWLRSSAAPAVQLSEKISGAPISAAIRFTVISATTKSTTAARAFGRKTAWTRMGTAIFAWLVTGNSTLWQRKYLKPFGRTEKRMRRLHINAP